MKARIDRLLEENGGEDLGGGKGRWRERLQAMRLNLGPGSELLEL